MPERITTGVRVAPRLLLAKGRHSAGLLLVLLASVAALALAHAKPLHILFIGNSLTAWNDLPGMFAALAAGGGQERPVTRTIAVGGFSLEDHWNEGNAQKIIAQGTWDIVVLQQGPSALPESRRLLIEYARRFAEVARKSGAKTALYEVWPATNRQFDFPAVHASYDAAARAVDGTLLSAGEAWSRVMREHSDIALYANDGLHPTREGTYLAALVMYRGLYSAPVSTLPALGLSETVARRLRSIGH